MKRADIELRLKHLEAPSPSSELEDRIQSSLDAMSAKRSGPTVALAAALVISLGLNIYFLASIQPTAKPSQTARSIAPPLRSVTVEPTPGDYDSQPILKRN